MIFDEFKILEKHGVLHLKKNIIKLKKMQFIPLLIASKCIDICR